MHAYHTIVVGGGPGGLACATLLAEAGKNVLLLERRNRIGPKVCAGGLPLSSLPPGLPEGLLERRFRRQIIRSNWQQTTISAAKPIICTVDRRNLGQWMRDKAVRAGVSVRTGEQVRNISENFVTTPHGKYGYDYLVGADGSASLVRRSLNIDTKHMGVGIHYQVPGRFQAMEWHLDTELFYNGYAWIFPHRESASVGACASRQWVHPKILREKLHRWATKCGIDLKNAPPKAALINFDYQGFRFGNKFLVGDAAGLASGLTGEGIYSALVSGRAAAKTILNKNHADRKLAALIRRQRIHNRVLEAAGRNKLACTVTMELFVMALRWGMIHYSALELGDSRKR